MSKFLDSGGVTYLWSKIKAYVTNMLSTKLDADGTSVRTAGILYGQVDSTSTSTVFTAAIPGVTEYYDGLSILLKNGVVTSEANFTININGLGAKGVYSNMAAATRETTIFNVNYTLLLVYDSTRVDGGCWVNYRGYYSDANSIGYQLRTNSGTRPATDKFYRYRILFSSPDGTKWIPSNTSTSTNATAKRDVIQRPIDPFGPIVYYSSTTVINANANVGATAIWQQYAMTFGYAFNRTGAALVLPFPAPVYIKCAPQSDGSAIIDADTPYVHALPNTKDGKIYIFLGIAYSATQVEIRAEHPVYWYDGTGIRLWSGSTNAGAITSVNGQTGVVVLDADDVGALPDSTTIPTKTSDLQNDSGFITDAGVTSFNGNTGAVTYTAPVSSVNTKTGAVTLSASDVGALPDSTTIPSAATATPLVDGTAAVGSSSKYAKEDHVHPTDTSRQAALVSGTNIKTINGNTLLGSGDLVIGGSSPTPMTDAEIEAAVSSVSVEHSITISGSATSYTADGRFELSAATAGEIVRIQSYGTITSISSVPTVEFETSSTGARLFVMPNEAITITVTVSSGGGSN